MAKLLTFRLKIILIDLERYLYILVDLVKKDKIISSEYKSKKFFFEILTKSNSRNLPKPKSKNLFRFKNILNTRLQKKIIF